MNAQFLENYLNRLIDSGLSWNDTVKNIALLWQVKTLAFDKRGNAIFVLQNNKEYLVKTNKTTVEK